MNQNTSFLRRLVRRSHAPGWPFAVQRIVVLLVLSGSHVAGMNAVAQEVAWRAPPRHVAPAAPPLSGVPTLDVKALQLAEHDYKVGHYAAALERFGMVAAMRGHPFAWLRVGNIWHRRGNVAMALDAYSKARDAASTGAHHRSLRYRAIMNMALLGLDQAGLALSELGPLDNSAISPAWRGEVALRLQELQTALPPGAPDATIGTTQTVPSVAPGQSQPTAQPVPANRLSITARAPE